MSKRKAVKILNPLPETNGYTGLRKANEYVSRGLACWEKGAIRFDHDKLESLVSQREQFIRRTQDQAGYDGVGQMRLDQIQGLPVAGPAAKLVQKGSSRMPIRVVKPKTLKDLELF